MLLGGWWKLLFVHWSCGRWDPTHQLIEDYSHCGGCGWYMYPFSRSPLQFLFMPISLVFSVIIAVSFLWSLLLPLPCPTTLSCLYRALLRFLSHYGFLSNSFPAVATVSVLSPLRFLSLSITVPSRSLFAVLSCDLWAFLLDVPPVPFPWAVFYWK